MNEHDDEQDNECEHCFGAGSFDLYWLIDVDGNCPEVTCSRCNGTGKEPQPAHSAERANDE